MEKDAVTVHFTLEPETFVKGAVNQIDQVASSAKKALHEFSRVNNVSSSKVKITKTIKLSFLENSLILSKCICKAELSHTIDMIVSKFSFIYTSACEIERTLAMSTALYESSFIARSI